ncbi:MAG: MoaD/ThiS family protein [Pseudomonadota bacterium]
MKIELRLYASLSCYMPRQKDEGTTHLEIKEGITIRELMEQLKVPSDAVKIVFLNGVHARGDEILNEGDRLGVFPPVAGG